jgi:hypothetical protein
MAPILDSLHTIRQLRHLEPAAARSRAATKLERRTRQTRHVIERCRYSRVVCQPYPHHHHASLKALLLLRQVEALHIVHPVVGIALLASATSRSHVSVLAPKHVHARQKSLMQSSSRQGRLVRVHCSAQVVIRRPQSAAAEHVAHAPQQHQRSNMSAPQDAPQDAPRSRTVAIECHSPTRQASALR